ncbi:hypothetical protein U9M48_018023 [Paspalum notatum var. saurae]|uniref:Retrotransposon gag domain-containing protein n=1 Tax=Paspalum notatum var. saurae TaxID=547442 RepID=A0AAQ3TAN9_PASNO
MTSSMEDFTKQMQGMEAMMQKTFDTLSGFEAWRTKAEESFGALLAQSEETASRLTRLESRPPLPPPPPPPRYSPPGWRNPFDLNQPPQLEPQQAPYAGARPSASTGERPQGHRVDFQYRDVGGGVLGPPPPHPVTGTRTEFSFLPLNSSDDSGSNSSRFMPKLDFPKFDGDNPRLWKDRCEAYFEVYGISDALKPKFAALNFSGAAATWLQTRELKGRFATWDALCSAVCERFDRDQYHIHMKQLDNLKQLGSVAEYHAQFEQLAHSILLYNPAYDDVYFVTRFLSGLKEEIRAPIALHRPKDLESASVLAQLQEQELTQQKKLSWQRSDGRDSYRFSGKASQPKEPDKGFFSAKKEMSKRDDKNSGEDKLAALRAFRKANGLCFTCGEKYTGRNHKCPAQVPLHIIQEIVDAFQLETQSESDSDAPLDESEEVIMSVQEVVSPSPLPKKRHTMRFKGFLGKQEILILLDSGSACTFVSSQLVQLTQLPTVPAEQLNFSTADGSLMQSDSVVPSMQWFVQGHTFSYTTRVLPLKCYDVILGADWLEDHSPTWIHWKKKIMKFPHKGRRIQLSGISDSGLPGTKISAHKLRGLLKRNGVVQCDAPGISEAVHTIIHKLMMN